MDDLVEGNLSGNAPSYAVNLSTRIGATSTESGGDTPSVISMEATDTAVSSTEDQSEDFITSIGTSTSEMAKSVDATSQPPPPAASTSRSSTNEGKPATAVIAPPPKETNPASSMSEGQIGVAMSSKAPPYPTATATAAPTFSTTAIAGTAAGGTVGIALLISLVFLLMRRHKRRASLASSTDPWEPSRNTNPKPKLPNIENDSSFGRYSEVGVGAPVRQRSKAGLHSEDIPAPRPQTAHHGFSKPPDMHGRDTENARYYHPVQRSEPHLHGTNVDSRYPEMASHAPTNMSSPTSPVSTPSMLQNWHANSPSTAPTMRLSSADLRSEGMRSPVSEFGTNVPLRSTRSAELYGAGTMSPMSELGTDSFPTSDHGAAELHTEPLLSPPQQLGLRGGADVPAGVVEMEDSDLHKGHRPGISTNF